MVNFKETRIKLLIDDDVETEDFKTHVVLKIIRLA